MNNRLILIASLNARSIFKDANKHNQRLFLNYLRFSSLRIDILCLQEVSAFHSQSHLTDDQLLYFQKFLFPNRSLIVTKHTAIICLNKNLLLQDSVISRDQRSMAAVVNTSSGDTIASIINMYAPADRTDRSAFFGSFLDLPLLNYINAEYPGFLLGDFNTNINNHQTSPWFEWISQRMFNCFPSGAPTFQRGAQIKTTIDYVFGLRDFETRISGCQQQYIPSQWTDHQLLILDLYPSRRDLGPGSWRFNPTLLQNNSFLDLLSEVLNNFFRAIANTNNSESNSSGLSPQQNWESLKFVLKDTSQLFSRRYNKHFKTDIDKLQEEYQKEVCRTQALDAQSRRSPLAHELSNEIAQKLDTNIEKKSQEKYLRSATRWYELGERNDKYFYRVIKARQTQQTIQAVKCAATGELVTNTTDILSEARIFYSDLYSPDDIDSTAIESLLQNIPNTAILNNIQSDAIDAIPTEKEYLEVVNHSPLGKSPGLDGLPFELYRYLFKEFKSVRDLFLEVLKDAFNGIFPVTLKQTRTVLLFKKGDPTLLSNWRPLSLINTDAKIFTKLLANRFNRVLPFLINPYQTGFIRNRLISDNGWVNLTLMSNHQNSSLPSSNAVAVLLDQEKAYDRVHPGYMSHIFKKFGFSDKVNTIIQNLFFDTSISISINGFLGAPVTQGRGLRQGDPLSPLLYNLAFEPLLRTILASSELSGVSLRPTKVPTTAFAQPSTYSDHRDIFSNSQIDPVESPKFILLSYADDLEVFLSSPVEWAPLQSILQVYSNASNAKVNIQKTEMVSLSGLSNNEWKHIAEEAGINYHTATSPNAIRYLGYPLYSSPHQLTKYLDVIKNKILVHVNMLKERRLSVRGSSLVANSLLLSQLWHILRVVPIPKNWLLDIQRIIRSFVLPFWPAPAWDQICLPKSQGGLGVVDPQYQQIALKLIYLQRLLQPKKNTDFVTPFIRACINLYTGHCSYIPWLQFPNLFMNLFKKLPTMFQLSNMIFQLPPLKFGPNWSGRWLADTPLKVAFYCETANSAENSSTSNPTAHRFLWPKDIALRYLVSDMIQWNPSLHRFHNFMAYGLPKTGSPLRLYRQLQQENNIIRWSSDFIKFVPLHHDAYRITPPSLPSETSPLLNCSEWVPNCNHWMLNSSSKKPKKVSQVTPGMFRLHMQLQNLRKKHPNRVYTYSGTTSIPFTISNNYFSPAIWKMFWHLPLPHSSLTIWWRLLNNKIGYQNTLFRWNSQLWSSSVCPICRSEVENNQHFFVSCFRKWPFWEVALKEMNLQQAFPTPESVWIALFTLHDQETAIIPESELVSLGVILDCVWRYHWMCVFGDNSWSHDTIVSLFESSIARSVISSPYLTDSTMD